MACNADEIVRRERVARAAIKLAFGTEEDEFGVTLFVSHHIDEIEVEYWQAHLGSGKPDPVQILNLLALRSHWGDDGIEVFDFTLPEDVTNYVISVRFDEYGEIEDISMES